MNGIKLDGYGKYITISNNFPIKIINLVYNKEKHEFERQVESVTLQQLYQTFRFKNYWLITITT